MHEVLPSPVHVYRTFEQLVESARVACRAQECGGADIVRWCRDENIIHCCAVQCSGFNRAKITAEDGGGSSHGQLKYSSATSYHALCCHVM